MLRVALWGCLIVAITIGCSEDPSAPINVYEDLDLTSPGISITTAYGPCPADADCEGFTQLLWDGTLRVDRIGELPERAHESAVTGVELAELQTLAASPALQLYLANGSVLDCNPPTDASVELYLVANGEVRSVSILGCSQEEITAISDALRRLKDKYAPYQGVSSAMIK
jgi:hypothetical protein